MYHVTRQGTSTNLLQQYFLYLYFCIWINFSTVCIFVLKYIYKGPCIAIQGEIDLVTISWVRSPRHFNQIYHSPAFAGLYSNCILICAMHWGHGLCFIASTQGYEAIWIIHISWRLVNQLLSVTNLRPHSCGYKIISELLEKEKERPPKCSWMWCCCYINISGMYLTSNVQNKNSKGSYFSSQYCD